MSTVQSCPKQVANMIGQLSGIIMTALSLVKFPYTSFKPSLETDIKFKHKLEVCRALFRVIF